MSRFNRRLRLGYACIQTDLRLYDVYTSRDVTLARLTSQGMSYVESLVLSNLSDLLTTLISNEAQGIRLFRISSNLLPHYGNSALEQPFYSLEFAKRKLATIGKYITDHGHTVSMHPGQYVQLASPDPKVVQDSIRELQAHAIVFEMMKVDGVIILHGGGTYGDREAALVRWESTFMELPDGLRNRIVLENDENGYNPDDLLPFCERLGIPFCFDLFHNRVSYRRVDVTLPMLRRMVATWGTRTPKIHYSEQDQQKRRGAHSKSVSDLPLYVLLMPRLLSSPIDVMLEVKDKQESTLRLYQRYFTVQLTDGRIDYVLNERVVSELVEQADR